ncbi:radical SAM family heme chaperone HemW [soil metagenome]
MDPIAVYVHIPFCPTKCGYCDFNSYAMEGEVMQRTTEAIIAEIQRSPVSGRPAKSIFFGGGTPTYLPEEQLISIFETVLRTHPPLPGAEITSEANPGTVDAQKFSAMRNAGFNRISLGAQSFQNEELLVLGRVHKAGEIERAVGAAREAGFDNLNLDLMFALPNQRMEGWKQNLQRALALDPEHLSLYCLTIEPNTAFYKKNLRGQLDLPDDEKQVAMYDHCLDEMEAKGYEQYEISNFAKPNRECKHNLSYWNAEEYVGYGPGAVGAYANVRYTNLKHPDGYCKAINEGAELQFEKETLTKEMLHIERVMLGLRLNRGTPKQSLEEASIKRLIDRNWIKEEGNLISLTRAGRHFCSEVCLELI